MITRTTVRTTLARARRAGRRELTRVGRAAQSRSGGRALSASQALQENGFTLFRAEFSRAECAALARQLKADAGIVEGTRYRGSTP